MTAGFRRRFYTQQHALRNGLLFTEDALWCDCLLQRFAGQPMHDARYASTNSFIEKFLYVRDFCHFEAAPV